MAKEKIEKLEPDASKDGERFEDLIAAAESIVKKLEGGQLTLEESVAEWQKGMDLLKRGETLLSSAERRVEILSETQDEGGVRAVPFDEDEDEGGGESGGAPGGPRKAPPRPGGGSR